MVASRWPWRFLFAASISFATSNPHVVLQPPGAVDLAAQDKSCRRPPLSEQSRSWTGLHLARPPTDDHVQLWKG